MKLLVCFLLVAAGATSYSLERTQDIDQWETFKIMHVKSYESSQEEEKRKLIFMENLSLVRDHNVKHDRGEASYRAGINSYSDLTREEAAGALHSCFKKTRNSTSERDFFEGRLSEYVPDAIDWRKKGAVTPIKNQGFCGSCWAFATTGSLESMNFLKTGKLVSLSEQNLIDCDKKDGGCHGGDGETAYEYIIKNGGIDTEDSYPYTGVKGKCHYNPKNKGASVKKYISIPEGDEDKLKTAVATQGPTFVGIDATSLIPYESGIFSDPSCTTKSEKLNHAVVVVGYGTTAKGEDYWLVKNSWGSSWGMSGYFMLARNKDNMCGVATDALFPVVA